MREHHQPEAGGAAHLDRVGVGWANAEVLGEDRGQHDVRHRRRVAADQAVDVAPFEAGIGQCRRRSLAHQVERAAAVVSSVAGQPRAQQPGLR